MTQKQARPELTIGLARWSEAAEIARLSRDLIEAGLPWSWTPARIGASIRCADTNVVVARSGHRIAGFGIMRYGDDIAHLDLFAVAWEYRRAGLGRRLIEWLEEPARLADIATAFLEVRSSNHGARAFYDRLGYRNIELLPRYYQGRESAVRMAHQLGARVPRVEPMGGDR